MDIRYVGGFCLLCFALCVATKVCLRKTWLYFVVSITLPPLVVVGIDFFENGYLDTWTLIAFVVVTFLAFVCSLLYFIAWRVIKA